MHITLAHRQPKNITCEQRCSGKYTKEIKRQIRTRKSTHNMSWQSPRVLRHEIDYRQMKGQICHVQIHQQKAKRTAHKHGRTSDNPSIQLPIQYRSRVQEIMRISRAVVPSPINMFENYMDWTIIHQTINKFEKYVNWTIIHQTINKFGN